MSLIQLPNGDWIAPRTVTSVTAKGPITARRIRFSARCVVHHINDSVCLVGSYDDACILRDKLAEQINQACVWEARGCPAAGG